MNHCVPDFDIDEYHSPSSGAFRQKNIQEDEMMELVWHNGQLGMQDQNQRFSRKSPPPSKSQHNNHQEYRLPPSHPPPPESDSTSNLFMQEDEMTSWLNFPVHDTSIGQDLADLLYHPPGPPTELPSSATVRTHLPADLRQPPAHQPLHHYTHNRNTSMPPSPVRPTTLGINFPQFARLGARSHESRALTSSRDHETTESTVVGSSDTPTAGPNSLFSPVERGALKVSSGGARGCDRTSRNTEACEVTVTSSAGCSGGLMTLPPTVDRKRKGRESADDATTDSQSEDLDFESSEANKQSRVSAKRPRPADVHNLSERRRRDKINEKMRALQELIPRCNKTDKASMLDEAIEYLKSLQMQVQMMSMGFGMVPVMFPGAHQYMSTMGMGLGMGMGSEMGINRPMMPFPSALAGPNMQTPNFLPRFPVPTFPMPPFPPPPNPSTMQPSNHMEWSSNPQGPPGPTTSTFPLSADPYQHYLGGQHMPVQIPQEQPSCSSKPSTSRESGN